MQRNATPERLYQFIDVEHMIPNFLNLPRLIPQPCQPAKQTSDGGPFATGLRCQAFLKYSECLSMDPFRIPKS